MKGVLEKQFKSERFASDVYLFCSYYFKQENLHGIAKWLLAESNDESKHADSILDYILMRSTEIDFAALTKDSPSCSEDTFPCLFQDDPKKVTSSEIFGALLALEQDNFDNISACIAFARVEGDMGSESFLVDMLKHQMLGCEKIKNVFMQAKAYEKFPGLMYHLDAMIK